ncbi:hypothetical protein GGP55_001163 [Salinibacter ruber]|uniref:hypothetical protein n=1 Tax=Salinibacter ruber TaxID=146919 RepID=UPI0021686F19|nr:hypothetical protein [Salinibacter ruber]MCS3630566.1 hypothetical protein [Salinibacter ruber]
MRQLVPSFRPFCAPGAAAILAAILILGGCDPSVSVLNPSDQYRFSLFGTLNVAADTQVIRVDPLGDTSRVGSQKALAATVRLENVETGTQVTLADSFETIGEGSARFHNLKTTHPIRPDTRYRVSVRVEGTPVTTATTTTPARPPTLRHEPTSTDDKPFLLPCLTRDRGLVESANTFTLRASAVESLAAVQVLYPIEGAFSLVDHYNDAEYRETDDLYRISVYYGADIRVGTPGGDRCTFRSQFVRPHARVAVTAGGPDWPDWRGVSINDIARPDTFTNVEGGHGFVGGVYSDTIQIPIRQRE